MKIGLYFGSFNPVHIGHLIVANTMIEEVSFDRVWLVISPQNPFKLTNGLAPEQDRKAMAQLAVADHGAIEVSDIEFSMPKPSYTIDTLKLLFKTHTQEEFSIIMGMDNLLYFHKWKEWENILEKVDIHVYDRTVEGEVPSRILDHPKVHLHHFPLVHVSSTRLRKQVSEGRSIRYWVPAAVESYIREHGLFR
jgi:nicotinate-nucleotide adenylyltransferase